jgi:hypothetical protein
MPKKPLTAQQIFENKNFNSVKLKMEHMSHKEIIFHLKIEWDHKLTEEEKQEFDIQAEQGKKEYVEEVERVQSKVNKLRDQIH